MNVFISWSGDRSGQVANALATWLPKIIQSVRPWLSSASIDPGTRWNAELTRALEDLQYGVLCLTPENIAAPWVLFEAGALSKAVSVSRVIPYLVGFEPRELQGPLAQFQAVRADMQGTQRLVTAINVVDDRPILSDEILSEAFKLWWPRLAPTLAQIALAPSKQQPPPQRSVESMVGELLELVRGQSLSSNRDVPSLLSTPIDLGKSIRHVRQLRGFTQRELAERAAISQAYLAKIEADQRLPSFDVLNSLCDALGVSFSSLVDRDVEIETDE